MENANYGCLVTYADLEKLDMIHTLEEVMQAIIDSPDEISADMPLIDFLDWIDEKTMPFSIEEIQEMDPEEVKYEMKHNEDFYYDILMVFKDQVNRLIRAEQKAADKMFKNGQIKKGVYNKVQKAHSLYGLIESGYYSDDYDISELKVINKFVDKYVFTKRFSQKSK